jgi:hypothetical protein
MHARSFSLRAATALAATLVAAPLSIAHAQDQSNMNGAPSRFMLEGYLAQYSVDVGDDRTGIGGVGARLMFGRGGATNVLSTFFQRARAGVFVTYTGEQKDIQTLHYGVEGDFPLFAAPRGWLDPVISVGLGGFRTSVDVIGEDNSSTDFALTPGAGTRIPITGSIAFRGDLRDVIVFGPDNTSNNWVAEGGISIGF